MILLRNNRSHDKAIMNELLQIVELLSNVGDVGVLLTVRRYNSSSGFRLKTSKSTHRLGAKSYFKV